MVMGAAVPRSLESVLVVGDGAVGGLVDPALALPTTGTVRSAALMGIDLHVVSTGFDAGIDT